MNENEKVSVYITTFNRKNKLLRALRSVQDQTHKNIEILICDDASTDGTELMVLEEKKKDNRIKYLRNIDNKGACASRNNGIVNATGKFITGLDDDDEFSLDRIEFFLNHWDDKYSFLCCNFMDVYENEFIKKHYKSFRNYKVFSYKDLLFANKASNQIFTLTSRLKAIDGFDIRVKRLQDWDTWLRLSFRFGPFIRYTKSNYFMYHDHNLSEKRVSQNDSLTNALATLLERNKDIYSEKDALCMRFFIKQLKGNSSLVECLYWSVVNKNPKYFVKYFFE
ncbi:glycosyltransferase [Affinibrenneria salicis]|uniref:Glycosyltransferase n=1 Tax=Affinibrenneria salicis TaxID=2590031 RepID=A0A5J5FZU2_9GAMM|nr:glycosyltransferase [Affinibrenneria salicis]KAA8999858.1 glycosyltransferase [Affinibrenneria salicis]